MHRGLTHYWRINIAVVLAVVVNTAVLAGALIVGDSVRGSLRDMTLDRLGDVDLALASERFFPEPLATRLDATPWARFRQPAAPAVLLPGSAVHTDTGARSSQVSVHGIDERFVALFAPPEGFTLARRDRQFFPSVVINETLQRRLDAAVGDAVLLNFRTRPDVPEDTLLGNKQNTDTFGTLRATVTAVIPDAGMGRFSLTISQAFPANAFVALDDLQAALEQTGKVNALFVSNAAAPAADDADNVAPAEGALREVVGFEDLGLVPAWHDGRLLIESDEYVLRPPTLQAVEAAAGATGAGVMRVTSYLATDLAAAQRSVPYSTVAALDGAPADLATLTLTDGSPAPALAANEILLNEWTLDDLGVAVGEPLTLEYYVVGPYEELDIETADFVVAGGVAMRGLGADRKLTPDYPGIEDTDNIADWDPPFPVDLTAVRTEDEDYWDRYGATPKAFVSPATAARLWSTRYGIVTSVRLTPPAAMLPAAFEAAYTTALLERLRPAQFGMRFVEVRADGLAAASGATDFSGLFVGFSFFIIAAAAMLVGLLFRLGVETRAGEIGLLLAVGYETQRVRRRMLLEGAALAAVGTLVGLAAGVGYAALMMVGLRTLWLPAVGTTMLALHITPMALGMGAAISMSVVLASIWWTVRRLGHAPATALLKGSVLRTGGASAGHRRLRIGTAIGAALLALTMLADAIATGATMDPMVFGTIGLPLLVAGLAAFAQWCRSTHGAIGRPGAAAIFGMAARNSAWNPARSILSVALVAFASFVIVTVAANYRDPTREVQSLESGTGGFALFARADIPIHADLNSADGRFDLGFDEDDDEALFDAARVIALRSLPGDDASCLNLYRPQNPRLLGIDDAMIERGGFRFAATLPPAASGGAPGGYEAANPWTLLRQDFGPGVVPVIGDANSVQWILHMGLGDELAMVDEFDAPLSLRIVGVFAESIFRSELLMSEENLLRYFPSRSGYSTFLVDVDGDDESAGALAATLERTLAPYGFDAEPTDQKLADFLVVQNTYLSTFQLLGGLGLLLGTVGLAVVLARNVIERRAELATLRAFGFRRGALSRMVLIENAFLLLVGAAIGASSALLAVAPRFVGGQLNLPAASLLIILLAVLLVGMTSSIAAVAGALRTPLLPVLKGDR